MRHLILFFLFLVSTMVELPVHAVSPTAGDRAYEEKNFTQALQSYQAEVRANPSSAAYYNLGNAHYRLKEYGKAVLAYRRSLRLDPDNADARHNLALVESNLTKAIPTTDNSLWQALRSRWIDTHSLAFWTYGIFIFSPAFIPRIWILALSFEDIRSKDRIFQLCDRDIRFHIYNSFRLSGTFVIQRYIYGRSDHKFTLHKHHRKRKREGRPDII